MRRYISAATWFVSSYGACLSAFRGYWLLMLTLALCALYCWDDMMTE